ncbi:hypothetical protein EVAR_79783_1 [Eumeta japonica]|uniref:Uncharacterized protein n=1 Tax=Eumeta variegata TaxID=151549 RepID=A0A4C1SX90_EUMVA|nr:hypothetical protein EVAR_79783_1 [Eumeta japonica]
MLAVGPHSADNGLRRCRDEERRTSPRVHITDDGHPSDESERIGGQSQKIRSFKNSKPFNTFKATLDPQFKKRDRSRCDLMTTIQRANDISSTDNDLISGPIL